jgi:hypothetical protein
MIAQELIQKLIVRQTCIKAAVDYWKSREGNINQETIIQSAQIYENWIWDKQKIDLNLDDFKEEK